MQEEFRDIPGYEGIYQVSDLGNVKSLPRIVLKKGKYPFVCKEKILKYKIGQTGYYELNLYKDKKKKTFTVHQLVAMAFLNHIPCGYKLVIDHINDISTDNRVENLQIVTQRYNARKTQGDYSSKYKGVSWHKRNKKWVANIQIDSKHKHLGSYTNEYEAYLKYQEALNQINKNK